MNHGPEKNTADERREDVWAANVIFWTPWLWRKYIIYVWLWGKLWNASAGRNGKSGFFHFWSFFCIRKWQLTFQWEHCGFCYEIYNPPKKFKAVWKNFAISFCSLSPNLYPVTWSCTLLWGETNIKGVLQGKKEFNSFFILWFLHLIILHPSMILNIL